MQWEPIESLEGKMWKQSEKFDVWAKWWDPETDQFIGKRIPNCFFDGGMLRGVPFGLRATHWMPVPAPPDNA